jgi:hypothetical protein
MPPTLADNISSDSNDAGISMKSLNVSFNPDTTITLQTWIIIFGCIQLVLSQFPTIHDRRFLNVICTMCTAGFAITATGLSIYNGSNPAPGSPPVDYSVLGDTAAVTFGVFSALGTIAFGFGRFFGRSKFLKGISNYKTTAINQRPHPAFIVPKPL